jgi:hypothetical protein
VLEKIQAKISDQLEAIEYQLLLQQMKPPNKQNQSLRKELTHPYHIILATKEASHSQRYKKPSPPMVIEIPAFLPINTKACRGSSPDLSAPPPLLRS